MDNINLEHDSNLKSLNIDIDTIPTEDTGSITFTKNNDMNGDINPSSPTTINLATNDIKPHLSTFDRKDVQIGLDLLENPNKKKKQLQTEI